MPDTTRIALCGKGGVGKTSVAAIMVKLLSGNGRRKVLAIDADPACGLAVALGVTALRTVDDIRKDLIDRLRQGMPQAAPRPSDSWITRCSARCTNRTVRHARHRATRGRGCFCKVNSLLKDIIVELAGSFDVVVIDGEAGV